MIPKPPLQPSPYNLHQAPPPPLPFRISHLEYRTIQVVAVELFDGLLSLFRCFVCGVGRITVFAFVSC